MVAGILYGSQDGDLIGILPWNVACLDVNIDGSVNVIDIVETVDIILSGNGYGRRNISDDEYHK